VGQFYSKCNIYIYIYIERERERERERIVNMCSMNLSKLCYVAYLSWLKKYCCGEWILIRANRNEYMKIYIATICSI
jgi:hypothetical protein